MPDAVNKRLSAGSEAFTPFACLVEMIQSSLVPLIEFFGQVAQPPQFIHIFSNQLENAIDIEVEAAKR